MTYNEAIKLYDGSRRKMAEHLGLSVQAVQHYSKNPDTDLELLINLKLLLQPRQKLKKHNNNTKG